MKKLHSFLLALSLGITSLIHAGPVPWKESSYTYYAQRTTLGKALTDFAKTFGIQVKGAEGLHETLDGRFATSSPTEYLQRLSGLYGLSWYYYNGTLFFNRSNTNITKPIVIGADSLNNVKRALTELGILEPRFGWGELPEQSLVLISGPPSYIALLEKTVAAIPTSSLGQQVMVFRLRYANVEDRVVTFNDKDYTTPGVATIIRQLIDGSYTGGGGNSSKAIGSRSQLVEIAKPVRVGTPAMEQTLPSEAPLPSTPPANLQRTKSAPSISYDSRLNALIIKDTADTEPIYRQLIALLDHPTALIQIEAMIVDVNVNRVSDLGINWAGRAGKVSAGFGTGNISEKTNGLSLSVGSALNPTSTVLDAGSKLISRINMLEQKNDAQIIGRPSILTSDNLPALISFNDSFYVRVSGEKVANLQQVTAGMTLRVTPRVIQKEGKNRIYLAVDIEDGQVIPANPATTDSLPGTRTSTINTQAVLTENESLLIGGYIRDKATKGSNAVPVLSKVPVLGRLFRNTNSDKERAERLFMITPKIISLPVGAPISNASDLPYDALANTINSITDGNIGMSQSNLMQKQELLPKNFPADSTVKELVIEKIAASNPPEPQKNLAPTLPQTLPIVQQPPQTQAIPLPTAPTSQLAPPANHASAIPGNLIQKQNISASNQQSFFNKNKPEVKTEKMPEKHSVAETKKILTQTPKEAPKTSPPPSEKKPVLTLMPLEAEPAASTPVVQQMIPEPSSQAKDASIPAAQPASDTPPQKQKSKKHSPFFFWWKQ